MFKQPELGDATDCLSAAQQAHDIASPVVALVFGHVRVFFTMKVLRENCQMAERRTSQGTDVQETTVSESVEITYS